MNRPAIRNVYMLRFVGRVVALICCVIYCIIWLAIAAAAAAVIGLMYLPFCRKKAEGITDQCK